MSHCSRWRKRGRSAPLAKRFFSACSAALARFGFGLAAGGGGGAQEQRTLSRHRPALDRGAGAGRARTSAADRRGQGGAALAPAPPLLFELRRADASHSGRLEARLCILQGRAFPAHRSGGDHAGDRAATNACSAVRRGFCRRCGRALPASSSRAKRSRTRCGVKRARKPASPADGSFISGRNLGHFHRR